MRALVGVAVLATACGRFGFDAAGERNGESDANGGNPVAVDAAPGTLLPAIIADTYILGIDSTLNGSDPDVLCGRYSGNGVNMWALFRFDLTNVPQQAVAQATLRLYQFAGAGSGTLGFVVYRVTQAWDEATASWTDATASSTWTPGGAVSTNAYATTRIPLGTVGFYDWDITTLVNEWLTGAQPSYGLEIQYDAQPQTGSYAQFASREHATAAWQPQLLLVR